ncbi:MAG: hypothetical protein MUC89_18400 [Acetobacteraceae bacterium]|jgi:hypothetical protein|nr:hypothetical protein [Anaerolineae bacterium]MCU0986876.1 hypothetical protein [Acetobacteraceae bacterium]
MLHTRTPIAHAPYDWRASAFDQVDARARHGQSSGPLPSSVRRWLQRRNNLAAPIGFVAGLAWAFVGSLLFGLGTEPVSPAVALLWLAGEVAIGFAMFVALVSG